MFKISGSYASGDKPGMYIKKLTRRMISKPVNWLSNLMNFATNA